jgi:phosphatidylinositol alpha-1,6-mannosyltransferase
MFNGRDGISLVSRVAASTLAAHGLTVNVYSLASEPNVEVPAGIKLWSAENSPYKFVAKVASAALGAVPTTERVLAMHVHLAGTAMPLVWRGAHLSIFLHGIEVWKPMRMRERIALKAATAVLANSECTVQRFFEANRDFRDLSIDLCPLGIAPLDAWIAKPRMKQERFALIVGRLVGESRYKGHDELLELWPAVLEQFPGFHLVIAGDGSYRPHLQQKASALGLQDAVHFTGSVSDEELQQLYSDCDFFVMPSVGEGFGLVYLEAMRAHKACIGAPGAAAFVIADGETGIIADPCSKDELLKAILALIGQPQRTIQMGNAGYDRFLSKFTAERFGKTLLAALQRDHRESAICAE